MRGAYPARQSEGRNGSKNETGKKGRDVRACCIPQRRSLGSTGAGWRLRTAAFPASLPGYEESVLPRHARPNDYRWVEMPTFLGKDFWSP